MKVRISKGLYVNSNTIISLEWRKFYPVLVIHERYEKPLKWTLRIIAALGIASSVLSFDHWYFSLGLALLIFLVEQFFERAVIEYTTMVIQPPPDFVIDHGQWRTNGFLIPHDKNNTDIPHFGPSYFDKDYAILFAKYLKSWINNYSSDDIENNLIVSFIIEPESKYTTYFYANLGRERLNYFFKFLGDINRLKKYGKRQQQFIHQMFYWNTLDFKDGYLIKKFLDFQNHDKPFFFTPNVIQPFDQPPVYLFDYSIKKYQYKIKSRCELNKSDPEYYFDPQKEQKKQNEIISEIHKYDIYKDIEKVLSKADDIAFVPNEGNSAGAIILCFNDPHLPYIAYKKLIENKKDDEIIVKIHPYDNDMDLKIIIEAQNKVLQLNNRNFNKPQFDSFKLVNGGGPSLVLLIGYYPAEKKHIILPEGSSPLIINWAFD